MAFTVTVQLLTLAVFFLKFPRKYYQFLAFLSVTQLTCYSRNSASSEKCTVNLSLLLTISFVLIRFAVIYSPVFQGRFRV